MPLLDSLPRVPKWVVGDRGYAEPLVEDSRSWEDLIQPIVAVGVPIRLRCLRVSLPRWRRRGRKVGHAALAICS